MILRSNSFVLLAPFLLQASLLHALSPSDIPADTPISNLVSLAKTNLAQGNSNDALTYFDMAVSRDPQNYLTIFQRGATHLSLGRDSQASEDFDRVLSIRPDFEGALLQRAKIKSRYADWKGARADYVTARKTQTPEYAELEEAEGAESLAFDAERVGDFEGCVGHAGRAILVAGKKLDLRQLRARCRFERGEVLEGVSDLQHVLQISPGSTDPHLQISSMLFYSLGDTDKGMSAIRKCLHSDPDSKPCRKLLRQEKRLDKMLKQVQSLREKRQFNSAVKLLVGSGEDVGLIDEVKTDVQSGKDAKTIHPNSPSDFYASLIEMACDFYTEMNNKKKALPYCTETLTYIPHSLPALLSQANRQLASTDYEACIQTLNLAKEHHPSAPQIANLLQKAQIALKRSKSKDYYAVLGVASDADARTIKSAYRKATLLWHPDKAASKGVTREEAEKKMVAINEAYEVLSDEELKARFDRGDDPNDLENQGSPFQGSPFGQGPGGQQFFFRSGGQPGGGFKFSQGGGGFQFPQGFGFG